VFVGSGSFLWCLHPRAHGRACLCVQKVTSRKSDLPLTSFNRTGAHVSRKILTSASVITTTSVIPPSLFISMCCRSVHVAVCY
jgi:hypothetical protein